MTTTDPHYKKTIELAMYKARVNFRVAEDLFSSFDVDAGTRLLLRTLAASEASRVLDLGSGYGPIALFLKAWRADRELHAVDRDVLAVEYTAANAIANDLPVEAYPSLGFDDVRRRDFDLIASNIPAKAGEPVIRSLLLDAGAFLAPGGLVAIVVIDRLVALVDRTLEEGRAEIVERKAAKGYTALHYRPPLLDIGSWSPAFTRGVYARDAVEGVGTVWGLPEFDSLHHATALARDELAGVDRGQRIAFIHPGQGHLPVFAHRELEPARLVLEDRDLLALRVTEENLLAAGRPRDATVANARSAPGPAEEGVDAVVYLIPEREPAPVSIDMLQRARALLVADTLIIGGSSTAVTRCVEALGLPVRSRSRARGSSAATIGVRDTGRDALS